MTKFYGENFDEIEEKLWELIRCLKRQHDDDGGDGFTIPDPPQPYGHTSGDAFVTALNVFVQPCDSSCCGEGGGHSGCDGCSCMRIISHNPDGVTSAFTDWTNELNQWLEEIRNMTGGGYSSNCLECLPIAEDLLKLFLKAKRWKYRGGKA